MFGKEANSSSRQRNLWPGGAKISVFGLEVTMALLDNGHRNQESGALPLKFRYMYMLKVRFRTCR